MTAKRPNETNHQNEHVSKKRKTETQSSSICNGTIRGLNGSSLSASKLKLNGNYSENELFMNRMYNANTFHRTIQEMEY